MRVLTVYAHPNPHSFCHAVLEQFTRGLGDAGHASEVVDLHAIGFNPVFGRDDYSFFEHVYFYAVGAVDDDTRREYLQQAYRLGAEFESGPAAAGRTPATALRATADRSGTS